MAKIRLKYISEGSPHFTKSGKRYLKVKVQCRCGKILDILKDNFKKRPFGTCGCGMNKTDYHGMHKSVLYGRWESMKARCYQPAHGSYRNYGARGITVCKSWLSFIPFMNWALNNGFDKSLELDRIDNDGDYTPENCRWVTKQFNNRNKRTNVFLVINGQSKTITEWSEISGIHVQTLRYRKKKNLPFGINI